MSELVHLREHEIEDLRAQSGSGADVSDAIRDIFGRIVGARMGEGKLTLSDQECIADSFIMVSMEPCNFHVPCHSCYLICGFSCLLDMVCFL